MRVGFYAALIGIFAPLAVFAASEGTPVYYQNYGSQGQNVYVGDQRTVQSVGQRVTTYQVPYQEPPASYADAMTPAGVATGEYEPWVLSASYTRRFADFQFKTGVNSVLEWSNMLFNEIGVRLDSNFKVKDYDLFAYGEYRHGTMSSGGFSIDYDLEPYDYRDPDIGIFTISVGQQTGKTDYMRFGFGAKHIWDLAGWKLSPSIGYEIFKHNLQMSDHLYPNPAVYIPLLNQFGDYIFGDGAGSFINVDPRDAQYFVDNGWYQVCLSPEDIKVAASGDPSGIPVVVDNGNGTFGLLTQDYDPLWMYLPWGVGPGECVIIGGDGPIMVQGVTHIYNTTWSGLFLGLEAEKQMTHNDKLRFYVQVGMPSYNSEGIWPNRTDWQQHPSFIDKGNNGAYSYLAEMEYNYRLSERLQLALKVDMNFFHVGKIGGDLFVASYTGYAMTDDGQFIYQTPDGLACDPHFAANCYPLLETVEAHTVHIPDSLKYANWQSFGLHLGVKYSF
ncbi:MAG: hypothetical protein FWF97_03930 [Alphaproteobacteria bacterium]|nr:hypothetical protein [Alphaproteobacteria bacterium]